MQKLYGNMKKTKSALILGASSDIGISVVKKFINEGWYVFAHGNKNINQLKKINNINNKIKIIKCNLNNKKDVKKRIEMNNPLCKNSKLEKI